MAAAANTGRADGICIPVNLPISQDTGRLRVPVSEALQSVLGKIIRAHTVDATQAINAQVVGSPFPSDSIRGDVCGTKLGSVSFLGKGKIKEGKVLFSLSAVSAVSKGAVFTALRQGVLYEEEKGMTCLREKGGKKSVCRNTAFRIFAAIKNFTKGNILFLDGRTFLENTVEGLKTPLAVS